MQSDRCKVPYFGHAWQVSPDASDALFSIASYLAFPTTKRLAGTIAFDHSYQQRTVIPLPNHHAESSVS